MIKLEQWYRGMGKQQKVFVYLVSLALVMAFGFGLLPLAILIGSGMTVESSKAALVEHKIVRKAINASIGKSA